MSHSIKHLLHIDAPAKTVFKALTTIEGLSKWWTVQTQGEAVLEGTIQFDFGTFEGPAMKVVRMDSDAHVTWECVKSEGWLGHMFHFKLDRNENKTRVRFSHDGWEETDDFYAHCSFSWGKYLQSLKQYCQTGEGEAFGSPGYR